MLKGPWQASMGTLALGSLPSFPVPLRRWCWWDGGEASSHLVSAPLILVQATELERAHAGRVSLECLWPRYTWRTPLSSRKSETAGAMVTDCPVCRPHRLVLAETLPLPRWVWSGRVSLHTWEPEACELFPSPFRFYHTDAPGWPQSGHL